MSIVQLLKPSKMKKTFLLNVSLLVLSFYSCSIPKLSKQLSVAPVPEQYTSNKTSAGISKPQEVFQSVFLQQLIDTVMANNIDLKIAKQRIELSRAYWLQNRAAQIPQVNAALLPSLRKFGLYTMDGAGNIVTEMEKGKFIPVDLPDYFAGIQSSWEIDLWGKLKEGRKAAALRIKAREEESRLLKTQLAAQTAGWYYELLAADEEIRMLDKAIFLEENAVAFIRLQKEAGKANELAVQQFEAQLLSMRALRVEVEELVVGLETSIRQIIGKTNVPIWRDSLFFEDKWIEHLRVGIPSELLINRPDIRSAEWELLANNADLQVARKSYLPSITLNATLGMQGYRPGVLGLLPESIAYSVLSGLTAPLVNKRSLHARFLQSSSDRETSFLHYSRTVVSAFNEVQQHLVQLEKMKKRYELKNKESLILSSSIDVATDLFKSGRANYLDVLMSTQRSLMSNIERIYSRKAQLLAITSLYRSLGGGWNP